MTKPALWLDFALLWRSGGVPRVVLEFVATAERLLRVKVEAGRAEL